MLKRGQDKVYFREIFLSVFHQKRFLMILLMSFFVFILAVIIYFSFFSSSGELICGDRTVYDVCSERKPYFCEQGILIEKASICGCFENLTIYGDTCLSEYQEEVKSINLDYILRGEEGIINFEVYEELATYLARLPRSISSVNGEIPSKKDFKLKRLDDEKQKYLLLPLVTEIQNLFENEKDQIRVAVSIVQKIPFGSSERVISIGGSELDNARYPYEVLYDEQGICGEKSELLAFILREMGYGVAFLYYPLENHETIAVKCSRWRSIDWSGYCFIETTGPSIITDDEIEYAGVGKLSSEPEVIVVFEGKSIGHWWYEFRDTRKLKRIRKGSGIFNEEKLENLIEKYGLEEVYNI
jgi:hypothetical protein